MAGMPGRIKPAPLEMHRRLLEIDSVCLYFASLLYL